MAKLRTLWPGTALIAALLFGAACRAPATIVKDGLPSTPLPALQCRPSVLSPTDTLVISISGPAGGEMSIESPRGVFFQLVSESPQPNMGPQLMTASELRAARELRLSIEGLRGLPYVYGATQSESVFGVPGEYRVRISERLNTDDGTPVAACVVSLRVAPR